MWESFSLSSFDLSSEHPDKATTGEAVYFLQQVIMSLCVKPMNTDERLTLGQSRHQVHLVTVFASEMCTRDWGKQAE